MLHEKHMYAVDHHWDLQVPKIYCNTAIKRTTCKLKHTFQSSYYSAFIEVLCIRTNFYSHCQIQFSSKYCSQCIELPLKYLSFEVKILSIKFSKYAYIHSSNNIHKLSLHKKAPQTEKTVILEKGINSFIFAFNKEFEVTLLLTFFV